MNITGFDPDLIHLEWLRDDRRSGDLPDPAQLLELKRYSSEQGVLSVYADLREGDAAALTRFRNQARALRDAEAGNWSHEQKQHFDALVEDVAERLEAALRERRGRGIALFAAPGRLLVKKGKLEHELLRLFHLPEAPRDELHWGQAPALTQLLLQQDEHPPTGVVLFDRETVRFFRYFMNEVDEYALALENPNPVPGGKAHAWHGYGTHNHQQWQEEQHARYLRQAALAVAKLADKAGWKGLLLASPDAQEARRLGEFLPETWRSRLIGSVALPMDAGVAAVREAAAPLVAAAEQREEQIVVERWIEELERPQGRAVTGLADTTVAVQEYRVHQLLADGDFHHPGWRCRSCGALIADLQETAPDACPYCAAGDLERRADIVGDLALQVLHSGGSVELLRDESAREQAVQYGRIGGLLRY